MPWVEVYAHKLCSDRGFNNYIVVVTILEFIVKVEEVAQMKFHWVTGINNCIEASFLHPFQKY